MIFCGDGRGMTGETRWRICPSEAPPLQADWIFDFNNGRISYKSNKTPTNVIALFVCYKNLTET